MISYLTKETLNGVVRLVQHIRYRNGAVVKRIINPRTGMPVAVIKTDKPHRD
jgi:hypothetical protein